MRGVDIRCLVFLAAFLLQASSDFPDENAFEISRVRRDIYDNLALDDPDSPCRNGGIHSAGRCNCIPPHSGPKCEDFLCVHGLSVGKRFDPKSLFFNRPCICNKGWTGDLCEYHLSEKCNNRGEWKSNHCECIGYFFGPTCQYTSKCVMGQSISGRCACFEEWEGEYCHRVICHHGYADIKNKSMSCICPKRYTGLHCDRCSDVPGENISAYPECKIVKKKPVTRTPRKHATQANYSRIVILVVSIACLVVVTGLMIYLSIKYRNSRRERLNAGELAMVERRHFLEEEAILSGSKDQVNGKAEGSEKKKGDGKKKRHSLANPFKWSMRKSSSATPTTLRVNSE